MSSSWGRPARDRRWLRDLLIGAATYFVSARLGLLFSIFAGGVSPVWPPTGLAIGLGLVLGRRVALGVFIGAAASDAVTNWQWYRPLHLAPISALFGLGAALECWSGVTLLRAAGFDRRMPRVRDVLALVLCAGVLATLLSALIGASTLWLEGRVPGAAVMQVWRTWWVGDALGVLSFTPVLLAWTGTPRQKWRPNWLAEAAAAGALVIGSSLMVFLLPQPQWLSSGMMVFAAIPVVAIVWVALRFDQRTAATAMLFVACAALVGSARETGAFAHLQLADRIWLLQMYLVLSALTTFSISSLTAEARLKQILLIESEAQLRRTSALARVGGFSWRVTDPTPRWSPELHEIFGVPSDGKPFRVADALAVMVPEDRARCEALLKRIREKPESYTIDFAFRRGDGAIRNALFSGEAVFDARKNLVGWDGAVQDVTERVQAENQLRAMQRALEQSQRLEALGLLAGGVAHDFNNLLAGVLANAGYMKQEVEDPKLVEAIGDIEGAARAASELCRQMLTFAGRARPALERIELSKLVNETARLLTRSIKPGAQLVLELAEGLPAIEGDPTQLRQIVMNLILNASDALGDGGRVVVRSEARRCVAGDVAPGLGKADLVGRECVFLSVADDGCGMSQETLDRIFEPFFTTKPKGRGLGLASTLGVVQQHGGALSVKSALGKGTTFTLAFPAAEPMLEALPAPAEIALRDALLVVDDDPIVQRAIERLLEGVGQKVHLASTIAEAEAQLLEAGELSVALIDLHLGKERGVQLIRSLWERRPSLPCVLMSGVIDEEEARALEREGKAALLAKPFTLAQLLEAVRAAALQRPVRPPRAPG